MTRYDWSKLDAGWSVEGEKLQLAAAHGFKGWACWDILVLEKVTGVPIGESTQAALAQLAKCRITEPVDADTRDWQALTEENERLREQIRKLQEKYGDWRDEVRQACDGVNTMLEPYHLHQDELTVRLVGVAAPDAFRLCCKSSRQYVLFDGVRTIEGALQLSIIVERLKKLGWTEAK